MSTEFYCIALSLVVITASARLTRFVTVDDFPPIKWLREKFEDATDGSGWQKLTLCGYCFSFWATAVVVAHAILSGVASSDREPVWGGTGDLARPLWWLIWGTFGASYLAAILMAKDGDDGDGDN